LRSDATEAAADQRAAAHSDWPARHAPQRACAGCDLSNRGKRWKRNFISDFND
jgi:hypothetical protein